MPTHQNKIALVTGSSRGLGRNIALQLARSGADVVVTYRERRDEADAAVAEIRALGRKAVALALDVGDTASFPDFVRRLEAALRETWQRSKFDFLVNNAGLSKRGSIAEFTEADFDALMNVHFKGVVFLTQRLLPLLEDGGRIVNTSSGLARFTHPGTGVYAAMKGAIEVFTRHLAREIGGRGIRVNVIAPGVIETDFTRDALANPGVRQHLSATIALGRVGRPDDIGGVVDFLCSDAAGWITGQRLEASGGQSL